MIMINKGRTTDLSTVLLDLLLAGFWYVFMHVYFRVGNAFSGAHSAIGNKHGYFRRIMEQEESEDDKVRS